MLGRWPAVLQLYLYVYNLPVLDTAVYDNK